VRIKMRPGGNNRRQNLVAKALSETGQSQVDKKTTARPTRVLSERVAAASIATGKSTRVEHIKHDPNRIRAWEGHNRDYAVLSEKRCADLIEGFQQPLGQQFPAIVRKVVGSTEYDFEYICGARRHWTACFLKMDLLIEVRALDDKEAFLLQDIENRDREDVSDYERAIDYKKALPIYFDGKASAMAKQLHIDKGNFSRMLALADVPKPIVEAYGDIRELMVRHGAEYLKLCADEKTKDKVVKAAYKLKGKDMKGTDVLKTLKAAAGGTQKPKPKPKNNAFSNKFIDVQQSGAGDYTVKFTVPEKNSKSAIDGVRKSLQAMLDELEPDKQALTSDDKVAANA